MIDLNILCANCWPPHALREHSKICQMASCDCRAFVAIPAHEPEKPEPAAAKAADPDDHGLSWYGGFVV